MIFNKIFIKDILRDKNSKKYSMTKVAALIILILLSFGFGAGIWIMIKNNEIDYFLIGELIALLLALLGYKNTKLNVDKQLQKKSSYNGSNDDDKNYDDVND